MKKQMSFSVRGADRPALPASRSSVRIAEGWTIFTVGLLGLGCLVGIMFPALSHWFAALGTLALPGSP